MLILPLSLVLIGLTLLASLSPLLTFAWLWQLKEWRWDRLMEHLQREGLLSQLLGRLRSLILLGYVAGAGLIFWLQMRMLGQWIVIALIALIGLGAMMTVTKKQRMPVWTQKARLMVGTALGLTSIAAIACVIFPARILLPLLPFLQPLALALAWMLLRPLDHYLKQKVMKAAKQIRERNPTLTVIGITGSVGKTTTKELIGHLLAPLEPLMTPEHVNTEMGVAQWMIKELPAYAATHKEGILIVEMGAYRKGEIGLMSGYVQQTMAVVTYVGTQHLALFGSEQALFEAKAELVTHLPNNGHAFLNGDNDRCRAMKDLAPCPVTIVSTGGSSDLEAQDIEETGTGIRFTIQGNRYDIRLHGTHNVTNVLLAIAVAQKMGIGIHTIREYLRSFTPPSRTFQVRDEHGVRILDDTHNSSAASIRAAIAWAKSQPYESKTLMMTGLIEMGEAQERSERELGGFASAVFDRAILLNARSAQTFAEGFGKSVELFSPSSTQPVQPGSLLVCVGKMPPSIIHRLLPTQ